MKKTTVLLAILGISLGLVSKAITQEMELETAEDHIAKGDEYYDNFDNKAALAEYKKAYLADTSNCEALWKLSRAHVDVGEQQEKTLQRQYYVMGEKYARKAVALCPDDAEAHFNLAVAVGRVALDMGGKKKVELSVEVKAEGEKALELDPNHDGALHLLGRWHREVANLSGLLKAFAKILYGGLPPASNEQAVEYFKKAIEIKPEHINHHIELARTYVKMKQWESAKAEYDKVLELPVSDADDPSHKEDAEKELKDIQKKLK